MIRDSQSYTGAFGLAVKVEVPPMHVIQNQNKDFGMSHFFVTTFLWYSILRVVYTGNFRCDFLLLVDVNE